MKVFTVEGILLKELYTMNIPRMDATVLREVDNEDVILLVINHVNLLLEKTEDCYKYYNFRGFSEPLDYATDFWELHITRKQGKCEKVKFSEETIQAQIKNYLNKRFKKERHK